MKVRGTVTITKDLRLPGPGGSVAAQGLVATSDTNGSLYWGHFYVLDTNESLSYRKGSLVMDGEKAFIAITDNAPGITPLNPTNWLELGEAGAGGTQLTQAQIDAINGANNPSGSNPFATVADINNLTLVGTDTVVNILLKSTSPPNNLWIASDTGVDSILTPVVIGDGLVSDGSLWLNIGPMRGPQGEIGPAGAGTEIVGSDTVANILLKDEVAGENTLWIATDDGVDDAANPIVAGDGLVSDGAQWLGIGAIRGPQGDKGDKGDSGETQFSGTYLIKGGIEWLSGYQYRVTADKYVIVGILYSAPSVIITLGSADPIINRTDTFAANPAGLIYVKTDSVEINEAIEVRISQVEVVANTTVDPTITGSVIYDEQSGGEWVASVISTNGASIDLAYSGDFISGGQSTRILNGRNVSIEYLAPAPITIATDFSVLTFRMKSLLTTSNAVVTMTLYNGAAKASAAIDITEFGYDYTNDSDWQYVSIYINYFATTMATVDKLFLRIDDPTLAEKSEFLIDIIAYQHGVFAPPGDGDIPEFTSQLINNGETGASPYATIADLIAAQDLQEVTDLGASTTNDIKVENSPGSDLKTIIGAGEIMISNFVEGALITPTRKFTTDIGTGFSLDVRHKVDSLTQNRIIDFPADKAGIVALVSDIDAVVGTFVHTQGGSSTVWNINHNLGKYPSVMVVDTGKSTIDAVVTYVDTDNITITLSPASAGYAYLN